MPINEEQRELFEREVYSLNQEGDGYYFTGYTSSDYMPDEKSKELFKNALNAIEAFRKYIEEQSENSEEK